MGFILRIYFIGLMAFVPSQDGKRMAVLLVDARSGYHASDGSYFPPHVPVVLARAASCKGSCDANLEQVARHLFPAGPGASSEELVARLRRALGGGGALPIDDDDLAVLAPPNRAVAEQGLAVTGWRASSGLGRGAAGALPADAEQKASFSWVPDIAQVVPEAGDVDPDCLAPQPRKGLVADRLVLDHGTLRTYRMAEFYQDLKGGVPSFVFRPLAPASAGAAAAPEGAPRGIADWTVVDIPVGGCEVTLTARPFGGGAEKVRRMTLAPASCKPSEVVEIAVVNLPDQGMVQAMAAGGHDHPEGIASHFEMYYELSKDRPALRQRLVPVVSGTYADARALGQAVEQSELLRNLNLGGKGGTLSRPICTQAVFRPSSAVRP